MLWLAHTHPATAAVAGVRLDAWLADAPCLCIAFHSHVAIVALAQSHPVAAGPVYPPLATVATVPLNARAIALAAAEDGVALLTDHPNPRVLFLRPTDGGTRASVSAVSLADTVHAPAELGTGMVRADALLVHTSCGVVSAVSSTGATQLPLPHPLLVSMAACADGPVAMLTIAPSPDAAGAGDPVLAFYAVNNASLKALAWPSADPMPEPLPAAAAHVPLPADAAASAHLLCGTPDGVLVFAETCILLVPPPAGTSRSSQKRRRVPDERHIPRLDVPPQLVVAATAVDAPGIDAVYAQSSGTLVGVCTADGELRMHTLATTSPAAGPQGVAYLGDGLVFVASAGGDSVLLYVPALAGAAGDAAEVHRWTNIGPSVDLCADSERTVTCSGTSPACSLRVVRRGVGSSVLAHIEAPGTIGVHALEHLLCVVSADGAQFVTTDGFTDVSAAVAPGLALEPPLAVARAADAFFYISHTRVSVVRAHTAAWDAPGEILAACVHGDRAIVATLDAVHVVDTHLHVSSRSVPFQTAGLAVAGDAVVAASWDPPAVMVLDSALAPAATWHAPGPITSLAGAWLGAPHVCVGLGSGEAVVLSLSLSVAKSIGTGRAPVDLAVLDAGVLACGERTVAIFADGMHIGHSALRYAGVRGAVQLHVRGAAPAALAVAGGVDIIALGQLDQLDVRTVPLGEHQPTSLTLGAFAALTTWPASGPHGAVRLLERDSLREVASAHLHPKERPNCSARIDDTPAGPLIVVGTGFIDPERIETLAGRLLGFSADTLAPAFALDVPGNVYAVQHAAGHIAAAIDAQVHTYELSGSEPRLCDRWGCAFIASSLVPGAPDEHGAQLVVGDAMRSLTVLRVDAGGQITELARDSDPYWTTAAAAYGKAHTYIGADIAMNVFLSRRMRAKDGEPSHMMRRDAGFHYGDIINKFGGPPHALRFCTAGGALGVVHELGADDSTALELVQSALVRETTSAGVSWDEWRTLRTDHRVAPAHGVIDGDFILRSFGNASRAVQERVIANAASIARRRDASLRPPSVDGVLALLDRLVLML